MLALVLVKSHFTREQIDSKIFSRIFIDYFRYLIEKNKNKHFAQLVFIFQLLNRLFLLAYYISSQNRFFIDQWSISDSPGEPPGREYIEKKNSFLILDQDLSRECWWDSSKRNAVFLKVSMSQKY